MTKQQRKIVFFLGAGAWWPSSRDTRSPPQSWVPGVSSAAADETWNSTNPNEQGL
jgi:hypothetical protein